MRQQLIRQGPQYNFSGKFLEKKIISHSYYINCSPRYPDDLTSPESFLWDYSKEKVYVNKPHTLHQLKDNIQTYIKAAEPETLRVVVENALEYEAEKWTPLKNISQLI